MKVEHEHGASNSGKTTRLVARIEQLVGAGKRVGAIKHTHHPLNERNQGDTARFLAAGALPVILAGDGEAIVFEPAPRRIRYGNDPNELLALFVTDVVVIEGFKGFVWSSSEFLGSSAVPRRR